MFKCCASMLNLGQVCSLYSALACSTVCESICPMSIDSGRCLYTNSLRIKCSMADMLVTEVQVVFN